MPTDDTQPSCPTAFVYESTEEARLLVAHDEDLDHASKAAAEAAYYLSDTIAPEERRNLLALAESSVAQACDREHTDGRTRAAEAIARLSTAAGEVQELLRGPAASSKLRIALRAIRRAIDDLAARLGIETDEVRAGSLPSRIAVILGLRA
jgi:hypothetical protein